MPPLEFERVGLTHLCQLVPTGFLGHCTLVQLAVHLAAGRMAAMSCPNLKGSESRFNWCPLCYVNLRGRESHRGHRWYRGKRRKESDDVGLRRCTDGSPGSGGGGDRPFERCRLSEGYPTLLEFLTRQRWDDGKSRVRGTLLVTWSEGRFRAWLNDKDAGRSAWVSQPTLSDLLASLEAGLDADDLEWRKDKAKGDRR